MNKIYLVLVCKHGDDWMVLKGSIYSDWSENVHRIIVRFRGPWHPLLGSKNVESSGLFLSSIKCTPTCMYIDMKATPGHTDTDTYSNIQMYEL